MSRPEGLSGTGTAASAKSIELQQVVVLQQCSLIQEHGMVVFLELVSCGL